MNNRDVLTEFNVVSPIPDEVIAENPNPLFDIEEDVFIVIPSYMAWCLRSGGTNGSIVVDGTVLALAELGRARKISKGPFRFKRECSAKQQEVVVSFLEWCLSAEPMIDKYTERALKHWRKGN